MTLKTTLALLVFSCALVSCSETKTERVIATEITEVELSEVPQNVRDVVMMERTDFQMTEVLKKVRDERIYYDVEGDLPNGEEIEFDVLMTDQGPKIVEIQRDLPWAEISQKVRTVVDDANADHQKIVRVIESVQADRTTIIYEIFVDDQPADPRFEVRVSDKNKAELLPARWKH